jgi:hypothetical protein
MVEMVEMQLEEELLEMEEMVEMVDSHMVVEEQEKEEMVEREEASSEDVEDVNCVS